MMSKLEKLFFLLIRIDDAKQITPSGKPIKIHPANDLNNRINRTEMDDLLEKLEKDDKVIKVISRPPNNEWGYLIDPLKGFGEYFARIQLEPAYQEFTGHKSKPSPKVSKVNNGSVPKENDDVIYRISYSEQVRDIKVNGFWIAKPDFDSENERFFTLVFNNPNRKLSLEEIEKHNGSKLKKSIHRIIADLGFTGDLYKIFFSASKKGVIFRNPITKQMLEEMGVERVKIEQKS